MNREIANRLAVLPIVLWAVVTIVFVVLRLLPGSAADVLAQQVTSAEQRQSIVRALGLDRSIWEQYLLFLGNLFRLDLGISYYSGRSVTALLGEAMPVTIELAIASVVVMTVIGIGTGAMAATFRNTWVDACLRLVATVFFSMPWFWLGILLILAFGVEWAVLPTFGRLPAAVTYVPRTNFVLIDAVLTSRYELVWPWLRHLILPSLTVGLTTAGFVTRISRASFVDTMYQNHVRTARMKGMSEWRVFWHHIFRNAALPIITIIGLQFGALLGGAVISEVVFSYPGIGRLMVNAIFQRDYPVVEGAALVIAFLYICVNLVTDIAYVYIDPRLRRT